MKTLALLLLLAPSAALAATKPVPQTCNAGVNQALAQFVAAHQGTSQDVDQDNIMVCGVMTSNSIPQKAGQHGGHEILLLRIPTANGNLEVAVITNDDLDGVVTGKQGDQVFAYGQVYVDPGTMSVKGTRIAAGLHEPHCATHRGADDGWVVVNGTKYPSGACPSYRSRR